MRKVLEQYAKHITRLIQRAQKEKRELTQNERKGIAWYESAAIAVSGLIAAPTPAWVGVKFEKKLY